MSWARKLFEYVRDVGVNPTRDLLTDNGDGPNRRLRVDVGQTGFFAGREFRTYKRFESLATGSTYVIKVPTSINIILFALIVKASAGDVHVRTYVGGTPGGALGDTLPIIPRNTMTERPTPYYQSQITITGGLVSFSGGTEIDFLEAQVASQGNQQAANVGDQQGDERGVGPNTYYIVLDTEGENAFTGTVYAWWEERP